MTRPKHKPRPYYLPKRKLHVGPFESPIHLDGFALSEWKRILQVAPWLTESDAAAIADRCLCAQRLMQAEDDIRLRGHICRTRNGKVKNQSVAIARDYRTKVMKYDEQLGLTPASRDKLSDAIRSTEQEATDRLEQLLCGEGPPPFARAKPQ